MSILRVSCSTICKIELHAKVSACLISQMCHVVNNVGEDVSHAAQIGRIGCVAWYFFSINVFKFGNMRLVVLIFDWKCLKFYFLINKRVDCR
jgi:hypothetical protein